MLEIATELQQTRFYQEVKEDGERSLILRQLTRRFKQVPPEIQGKIEALTSEQLESLGDALLDFLTFEDLQQWLQENQQK